MAKPRKDPVRDFDQLPDAQLIGTATVAELMGVSGVTVWRWTRAGALPPPIYVSARPRWSVRALRAHLVKNTRVYDAALIERSK